MADYEPFDTPLKVSGRGKPQAELKASGDGGVEIRIDWPHEPHRWVQVELPGEVVLNLARWFETGKFEGKDRSDIIGPSSNEGR